MIHVDPCGHTPDAPLIGLVTHTPGATAIIGQRRGCWAGIVPAPCRDPSMPAGLPGVPNVIIRINTLRSLGDPNGLL